MKLQIAKDYVFTEEQKEWFKAHIKKSESTGRTLIPGWIVEKYRDISGDERSTNASIKSKILKGIK